MINVYLYKGTEPFLINTKIDMLVKESKANEFNISTYDCNEVDLSLAIQDAASLPFLSDSKVVIIKNPTFLTNDKSHNVSSLIKYIDNPMERTYLIINACGIKINEKLEIVKLLNKKAVVNETKEIEEVEFKGWIKRQCDISDVRVEEEAIKSFYIGVGKDLVNAKNELDKMISYVGYNGLITKEIVNSLTSRGIQNNVFELSSAILTGNKNLIYKTYQKLVTNGVDIYTLINLTTKLMKDNLTVNLLLEEGLKQGEIAAQMGISPNRAYYLIKDAKKLDLENIKSYIVKLAELDYKIKSGHIEPKKGFEVFLFSL